MIYCTKAEKALINNSFQLLIALKNHIKYRIEKYTSKEILVNISLSGISYNIDILACKNEWAPLRTFINGFEITNQLIRSGVVCASPALILPHLLFVLCKQDGKFDRISGDIRRCNWCGQRYYPSVGSVVVDNMIPICDICSASIVNRKEHLAHIFEIAREFLNRYFLFAKLFYGSKKIKNTIKTQPERLKDMMYESRNMIAGYFDREEPSAIHITTGLNIFQAIGTMIHELTHLWIYHSKFSDVRLEIDEGFAIFTSYMFYIELLPSNSRYTKEIANNTAIIYGSDTMYSEAFHTFRKAYEQYNGVLDRFFDNFMSLHCNHDKKSTTTKGHHALWGYKYRVFSEPLDTNIYLD